MLWVEPQLGGIKMCGVLVKSSITPIQGMNLVQVSTAELIWPEAQSSDLDTKLTLCVVALLVEPACGVEVCRPVARQLDGAGKLVLQIFVLPEVSPDVVSGDFHFAIVLLNCSTLIYFKNDWDVQRPQKLLVQRRA